MMDDPRYYCKIVISITMTIAVQCQINEIYNDIEKDVIAF